MPKVVEALREAFASIDPRLAFAFVEREGGNVEVTVTELGDTGGIESMVSETLDLARLSTDLRAAAFVQGAAMRARARANRYATARDFSHYFLPSHLLPAILLDAEELTTAEAFADAAGEGFSLLARLEARALCDALAKKMPEAMAAVRRDDDGDLELVDAMFALFSGRWETGRTFALIRQAGAGDRRHLAPLLVAFLHETVRDEDLRTNAYWKNGKQIADPIAQDAAVRLLVRWGVDVRGFIDHWVVARVISKKAAAAAGWK